MKVLTESPETLVVEAPRPRGRPRLAPEDRMPRKYTIAVRLTPKLYAALFHGKMAKESLNKRMIRLMVRGLAAEVME